jgi:hypothetical protein
MREYHCVECLLDAKRAGSQFAISGDEIWDGRDWREPPKVQVIVGGTGYCFIHGIEAQERTKQYVINE